MTVGGAAAVVVAMEGTTDGATDGATDGTTVTDGTTIADVVLGTTGTGTTDVVLGAGGVEVVVPARGTVTVTTTETDVNALVVEESTCENEGTVLTDGERVVVVLE